MHIIECNNIKKRYGSVDVLKGISCHFDAGKHYVIQGASGSGKSTLLYLIGGLDHPSEGSILWEGEDYQRWSDERLAKLRNSDIGFIFQFHYLLPTMSIKENILLPKNIAGVSAKCCDNAMSEVELLNIAKRLGVDSFFNRYPAELSGGERQRVNLLRAISMRPKLLLCDEPTGNLDSENSTLVIDILHELATEFDASLIVVTHNEEVAMTFSASERLIMRDGVFIANN